ncbi:ubiquinone biosynthesis O-methyltransferase, mitochondrial isoform X2 [Pogoniulus pusillus]|uniref:ubiquinone biosynthesis O-methyltransferase, mitochondrial isoform X2 n=1 Tax=Pogoniulus pusillus TaxID=488313 RepID=UPI0030B94756
MWGGGAGRALGSATIRALGRRRAGAALLAAAGGDRTGLRGSPRSHSRRTQPRCSSAVPAPPAGLHGSRVTARRLCSTSHSSVDSAEVKKFQLLAHKWWDEEGEYSALHAMNDLRVPFIRDTLLSMSSSYHLGSPLAGVKVLDVGCGGGLLSEPLGRLGASVTGIDPLEANIRTADQHKSFDPVLAKRIQYKPSSLEEIVEESMETFDEGENIHTCSHSSTWKSALELSSILCCKQQSPSSVIPVRGSAFPSPALHSGHGIACQCRVALHQDLLKMSGST